MSKVEIQLNSKGVTELMKSPEIISALQKEADSVVEKCSKGSYETSKYIGENRANVSIFTCDAKTYYRNLKENELLKALGSAVND